MTKKFKSLCYSILLISLFFACKEKTSEPTKQKTSKPNIVVILCDDLGYGDLSSFGHPTIKTPNIDQLGKEGIKLTNFYASAPVCSPSRVGLLTGRNPNRAGIYDWIPESNNIPSTQIREDGRNLVHMQSHEVTIPTLLKTAGYSTCLSGKWHCNSEFNSKEQPQPSDFGFDHWFATHNNANPSHKNPNNFVRNGKEVGEIDGYSCQIIVEEAMNWLQKRTADTPFYLQVTFHEPHEPIASPTDLVEKYLPESENENQAKYFANVENMDKAVGRLVAFLKENYGENTLVLFSSDNGPETLNRHPKAKHSYGSSEPLKGKKLWTNDGGVRVPGIITWLGKDTYKGTSASVVSELDYLPTFCELASVELPEKTIDGESLLPLIYIGETQRTKPLLWCFYHALNDQVVAMRSGDWKILARLWNGSSYVDKVQNIHDGNKAILEDSKLVDFELYYITNDISEQQEISTENPEILKKMKEQLEKEYRNLTQDSYVWNRSKVKLQEFLPPLKKSALQLLKLKND